MSINGTEKTIMGWIIRALLITLKWVYISHLTPADISHLTPADISHLTPADISHLTPADISHLTPANISHLALAAIPFTPCRRMLNQVR
jgi:hypothetical protein